MSLEAFRRTRLVVMTPRSTAYEAARAMADSHVGSIVVGHEHRVVGIVTDRDLALDVVAGDLDGRATELRDVMSDEVVSCDVSATIEDVVRTMREHACRRVPITEGGRPVGVVTLDDLIVDGAVDFEMVRSIVRAQLEIAARPHPDELGRAPEAAAPSGLPPRRARALMRRRARAENTYRHMMRAVEHHTGLDRTRAEQAVAIVLSMICRRLTPPEARHFIAQLPSKLQPELESHLDGPDRRITTFAIEEALSRSLSIDSGSASELLYSLCEAIADGVSIGEIEAVRGQLPAAMKELFPPAAVRRAI